MEQGEPPGCGAWCSDMEGHPVIKQQSRSLGGPCDPVWQDVSQTGRRGLTGREQNQEGFQTFKHMNRSQEGTRERPSTPRATVASGENFYLLPVTVTVMV